MTCSSLGINETPETRLQLHWILLFFLQKNAENMIDIKCKQEGSLSNVAKCAANKI